VDRDPLAIALSECTDCSTIPEATRATADDWSPHPEAADARRNFLSPAVDSDCRCSDLAGRPDDSI